MKFLKTSIILLLALVTFSSCKQKEKVIIDDATVLHDNEDQLSNVVIYDVFTPPVASRIYAYTSLATYEAIRYSDPKCNSITAQLRGFGPMPAPQKGKSYNYTLAATRAFFTVAHKVTFSTDTLKKYEDKLYAKFKNSLDDSTYARSMDLGEQVGNVILKRSAADNYRETRGKPKYLGNDGAGRWRPTPPDYMDGVEYLWGTIAPLAIASPSQFAPPVPFSFSIDKNSDCFKQNMDVYQTNKHLTKEQIDIAHFWDDNPFVIEHSGHMMFADKKLSPAGHWMSITKIACKQTHANAVKTAQAYALTSVALFDSFITSWEVKYQYSTLRPVTYIEDNIDHNWLPLLQTPPFPEYTAGHSQISAASAVILTHEFGDNIAFQDTTELHYIGMQRHFDSFLKAAAETSMSRYYGGIHYYNSVKMAADQGNQVGELIWQKLKLTK
jgi:PAP2 superfamily protein